MDFLPYVIYTSQFVISLLLVGIKITVSFFEEGVYYLLEYIELRQDITNPLHGLPNIRLVLLSKSV